MLIFAAIRDISRYPDHPAAKRHPRYGVGVRSWHLRLSRDHVPFDVGRVESPRHLLFYRVIREVVVIGRLLHERMDLKRHLSPRVWRLWKVLRPCPALAWAGWAGCVQHLVGDV